MSWTGSILDMLTYNTLPMTTPPQGLQVKAHTFLLWLMISFKSIIVLNPGPAQKDSCHGQVLILAICICNTLPMTTPAQGLLMKALTFIS